MIGILRVIKTLQTFVGCFWPFLSSKDIEPRGNLAEADVIFAQSFGFRRIDSRIVPGLSNEVMARKLVWEIFKMYHYPMILQWEVAAALPEKPIDLWEIKKHRKKGKYLDSYEVALQTVEIMKKHGWRKIILIAQPWHMWRKIKIFEKMGIEIIIPPELWIIPFDKKSDIRQWWTKSWFLWIIREIPARLISLKRKWI